MDLQISHGLFQFITSEDLRMRLVSEKFVPKLPSTDQKDTPFSVARDFLDYVMNGENILKTLS